MAIPKNESEFLDFLRNFSSKIEACADALGVTKQEVADLKIDSDYLSFLVRDYVPALRRATQQATAHKNAVVSGSAGGGTGPLPTLNLPKPPTAATAGVFDRVSRLVVRIKNSPGYTPAIGAGLGIASPSSEDAAHETAEPPLPKLLAFPGGQVQLDFVKSRYAGVRVESQRGTETEWTHLDDDRYSPYLDERQNTERGKGEERRYRLRYLRKDQPVGSYSGVATIQTKP